MARSDYERPADYQINTVLQCDSCHRETQSSSVYAAPTICPTCGGPLTEVGESYPADPDEWDMERDSYYDDWRQKR